ncbi:hypothetical protein Tco_1414541 [Tanacetum coccineum]
MVVVPVDFLCGGTEFGHGCVVCCLGCELSVVSSGDVLWIVCVSSDKGVFGSVSFGKELVISGSVCEVCGGVRCVMVSSMVVVEEGFGDGVIGVECCIGDILFVLLGIQVGLRELTLLQICLWCVDGHRGLDGSLLIKYAAASIQYPQKCIGKFAWNLKALATSNKLILDIRVKAFDVGNGMVFSKH